jgi:hypothetical protein
VTENHRSGWIKSEWWSQGSAVTVREKSVAFVMWLQKKEQDSSELYRRLIRETRRVISDCKTRSEYEMG